MVYENNDVVAFFDLTPVAEYHTLVVPRRHASDIFEVSDDDMRALASAIRHICRLYRDRLGITDVQIVSSNGTAAQQDTFHLHFHIVPRSTGDGQDITWTPRYELIDRFPDLLARLQDT